MKIRGVSYAEAGLKRIYKHPGYSLQGKELHNILHIADRSVCDAVGMAFFMGVEAGARMTEKKVKAWQKQ